MMNLGTRSLKDNNLVELSSDKGYKKPMPNIRKSFFILLSLMFGLTWQFNAYAEELDYADKSGKAAEIIKSSEQYQAFLALQKKIAEENGDRVRKFEVYVDGVNSKLIKSNDDLTDVSYSAFPYLNFDKKNKLKKFEFLRDYILLSDKGHVIYMSFTPKYDLEINYIVENLFTLKGLSIKKDKTGTANLNLSELEELSYFKIYDSVYEKVIFPVKNKIKSLEVNFTPIKKFKNLNELKFLNNLVLIDTDILDLNELRFNESLLRIDVANSGEKLKILPNLSGFTSLEFLSFNSKYVKEITGIDKLKNIKKLTVGSYFNYKGISFPDSLIYLQLGGVDNIESPDLKGNSKLKKLSITRTKINEIKGFDDLENLEELYLVDNKIGRISGIDSLKSLKKLSLSGNNIKNIENLESLESLEEVTLSYNMIESTKGLSKNLNLKRVSLENNKIKKVEDVNNLTNLIVLDLVFNPIEEFDYSSVNNLTNTKIRLSDTPVGDAMTKAEKKKYRKLNKMLFF